MSATSLYPPRGAQSADDLAELLDLARDAIIVRSLNEATILYWNQGAEELYGWSRAQALGRSTHELLCTRFPQPLDEIVAELLRTGHWAGTLEHNTRDGRWLIVESRWSLRRDGAGQPTAFLEINTDVTARRVTETALVEARRQADDAMRETVALAQARQVELERSNRELQQFASVVAHDLRTPLASVHGYADLLRLLHVDRDDQEAIECIDYILTASARMNALMGDILAYARAGGALVPAKPVDCNRALREALGQLRAPIEQCKARITCGALPVVRGHSSHLTQLFQNLIGNALKFRAPDHAPSIVIAAQRDGAWWRVSVADDGIGLDPADAERIFGVFERAHARDGYDGSGLGLAICARIVERYGGRCWVESTPGVGATFYVTLPGLDAEAG